jgi:hypothetical protein
MAKDYISEEMQVFTRTLEGIATLKQNGQWDEVIKVVGANLYRLLRISPTEFRRLTQTGLLACLIRGGPGAWVPLKKAKLIALLKETGDIASAKAPPRGGYRWYLRALHVLLDGLAHRELVLYSRFLPTIEDLLRALGDSSLPVTTRLLLIQEYERRGQYGLIIDQFRAALERSPANPKLLDLGIALFQRLGSQNDATLAGGGATRAAVDEALVDLSVRKAAIASSQAG